MDAYYRSNPSVIVTGDAEGMSTKRPLHFGYPEDMELHKNTEAISRDARYSEDVNCEYDLFERKGDN